MPVSTESRFKTISVVLTREQTRRLEGLRVSRSTTSRDASFSEVVREVVEEGLDRLSRAPGSSFATSRERVEGVAA